MVNTTRLPVLERFVKILEYVERQQINEGLINGRRRLINGYEEIRSYAGIGVIQGESPKHWERKEKGARWR